MKKLFSILLILTSFTGLAQNNGFLNKPTQGNTSTSNQFLGQVSGQRGISGAIFSDTTTANATPYVKGKSFNQIATTSDNNTWYRSSDTLRWILYTAGSSSNCPGTGIISGSATWSGTALNIDVTDLVYTIICPQYSSNATTLTLTVADPTYGRFDVVYADVNGLVGVLTGTPSTNPVKPQPNPLTQVEVTTIFVPAGSTVPGGQTTTTIYNEDVEWVGASDVSGIDFAYTVNPYVGTYSTLVPTAASDKYVSWQNGSTLDITDYQYLKFYIRLATAGNNDKFLNISFYNSSTEISETFYLQNGAYGFDASLTGAYQLIVIPISPIIVSSNTFDKVQFYTTQTLPTFQLDKIYLLSGAITPPVISNYWSTSLNAQTTSPPLKLGTSDSTDLSLYTNGQLRGYYPASGLGLVDDTTYRVMLWNPTTKEFAQTYFPTIFASTCIEIFDSVGKRWIRDTCGSGGGSSQSLQQTIVIGDTTSNFFIHTQANGAIRKIHPSDLGTNVVVPIWQETMSSIDVGDSVNDDVYRFGSNLASGGGRIDNDAGAVGWEIENRYGNTFEVHLPISIDLSGNLHRHDSYLINFVNGYTTELKDVDVYAIYPTALPHDSGARFSVSSGGRGDFNGVDAQLRLGLATSTASNNIFDNTFKIQPTAATVVIQNGSGEMDFKTPTFYRWDETTGSTQMLKLGTSDGMELTLGTLATPFTITGSGAATISNTVSSNANGGAGVNYTNNGSGILFAIQNGTTSTLSDRFGISADGAAFIAQTSGTGLYTGTLDNTPTGIGTNNLVRLNFTGAGVLTLPYVAAQSNATDSMMVINASNGTVGFRAIPSSSGGGWADTLSTTALTAGTKDVYVPKSLAVGAGIPIGGGYGATFATGGKVVFTDNGVNDVFNCDGLTANLLMGDNEGVYNGVTYSLNQTTGHTFTGNLSVTGTITHTATTFAGLPTGVAGMVAAITDSPTTTWGANVTVGGGGSYALLTYNGTNWTVIGK